MSQSTSPSLRLAGQISVVSTPQDKVHLLEELSPQALISPRTLGFVNAHAVNMCHNNVIFYEDLCACDILLRDGAGMKILYRLLRKDAGLNLNGTDFIPELLALYRGQKIALMGTSEPYLSDAAAKIAASGTAIALTIDGFQPPEAYLALAQSKQPALIILAMGMPRQEAVARLLRENLTHACLIVCGGAILDFMGGKVTRAPALLRKMGLEWIYRLALEPKRLFGRYVVGNLVFLARASLAALGNFRQKT